MAFHDFFENPLVRSVLIVVVTVGLQMVLRNFIERLIRRIIVPQRFENKTDEKKREDTLITILRTAVAVVLWLIAILVILGTLGINLAALATGAGLFGVVIGLGAQNTIKDFLAGIFILVENQYRVGDIVTLSGGTTGAVGSSGLVEEITLRVTKLRDLDGTLNVVRNGEASIITNRTFKYSSVVIDVAIDFGADVDKVAALMNKIGLELAGDYSWKKLTIEPIQFLRVENFTVNGAILRVVGKVSPASQWDAAGEYRRRLLKAFKAEGVHINVPQISVHQAKSTSN